MLLAHSMSIRPCGDGPVGRHGFRFTGRSGNGGGESNEYRVCGIVTTEAYDFSLGHYLHPQGLKRSDPQSADVFGIHIIVNSQAVESCEGNDTVSHT